MYKQCHPKVQVINHLIKRLKLELGKLKNSKVQAAKVDLTKVKINTLAKKIGWLSEDVKMYMYLLNSKRLCFKWLHN